MSATAVNRSASGPDASSVAFRAGAVLAVLLAGSFMSSADVAIVNVAAASIHAGLRTSGTMVVLIVSSYTVMYATLMVTAARLGDEYGHRRVFTIGVAVFTGASLAGGLAPDAPLLLVARVVQGAGAALMVPQVMSIIQLRFEGERRARAIALYSTAISAGVVVGLVIGGALVSADLLGSGGWRPVFLINVPIGVALLFLTPRLVPHTPGGARRPLDLSGTLLIATTVVLLLVPAVLGQERGWPAWTFVSLAAGAVMALATVVVLRRRPEGSGSIVDVAIFRRPGVAAGFLSIFASTGAYGAFLFTVALLLQSAVGFSAVHTGLAVVPYALGFAAASLSFSRLPARVRRRAPAVGLAALALAYVAVGLLVRGGAWHPWWAAVAMAFAGVGYGWGFGPVVAGTIANVPLANARDASGSLGMAIQLGYVTGVTVLGSLFLSHAHLPDLARAGHAFAWIGVALAALAGSAGWLAARTSRAAAAHG